MPLHYQLAHTPLPTDLPYTNYRDADIAAGLAVTIDAQNLLGVAGDGIGVMIPAAGPQPVPYAFGVTIEKIRALRMMIAQLGRDVHLEVDGGIDPDTAKRVIASGANVLVAGTAVFHRGGRTETDYREAITLLKTAASC